MTTQTVDAAEIAALVDRCEAATGPDRDLDAAIEIAVFGFPERAYQKRNKHYPDDRLAFVNEWIGTRYTASLDAAMTLVPEGSLFTARTVWDKMKPAGLGFVSRYEKGEFGGHEHLYWMDEHQAVAATPALALTAAALRARAHLLQQERTAS